MIVNLIIGFIIFFISMSVGYYCGHLHYHNTIMRVKIAQFILFILARVGESSQREIIAVLRGIKW